MKPAIMFLLISLLPVVAGLRINEIMYDPEGNDNNKEFIEIFMEIPLVLTGSVIADNSSNDTLTALQSIENNYALIVEEGFNYSGMNVSVYSAGATIGNNLDNNGDVLSFFDSNGTLVDTVTYDASFASNNGKSLEYHEGAWHESLDQGGTPGNPNSLPMPPNSSNTNQTVCAFSISTDKQLYTAGEKVKLQFNASEEEFTILYWVEDLQQQIVKELRETSNANTKSFTPDLDQREQSFYFRANATLCNLTLAGSALFTVTGNMSAPQQESAINLSTEDTFAWGDAVPVLLQAYRGNMAKSVIELVVTSANSTKVSKVSKTTISSKYTAFEGVVPVQLKANCDEDFPDGEYNLVASGLGVTASTPLHIEGNICPEEEKNRAAPKTKDQPLEIQILDYPESIEPGIPGETVVFVENPNNAARKIALWSYVYKGSRSVSGEREANKQELTISEHSELEIALENVVQANPGMYKLKIKVLEEERKTPKEFVHEIEVLPSVQVETESIEVQSAKPQASSQSTPNVQPAPTTLVFESRSTKIKRTLPYALLILCCITIFVLVLKDKTAPEELRS